MKKKLFLCGIISVLPLLTACPDLGTFFKAEEPEELVETEQDKEVVENKEEEKVEEKEQPKENVEKEETKEEQKEDPVVEEKKEESIWTPDISGQDASTPLAEISLDKNQKPVLSNPIELSSNEGYTEITYAQFHEQTAYAGDSYTYGIKWEDKPTKNGYADISLNGKVMLEEGLRNNFVLTASNCWYKKAGDVYSISNSSDPISFPDVARTSVLVGITGNEERKRVWDEEIKRAEEANNKLTPNKFIYYLINTRAKNIENKQDSLYLVTYTGDTSQKTFKYYISKDGFKFTFTCSRGTTEYIFNDIGRVTKVTCSSSQYENFVCNITYKNSPNSLN